MMREDGAEGGDREEEVRRLRATRKRKKINK
jgi:hypothetical protein